MIRLAIKILVLLALVLAGWWWVATGSLDRGVQVWLESLRANGMTAHVNSVTRGGFPFRIATTLKDITLNGPATNTTLSLPEVKLSAPIYWPGDAMLRLSDDPVAITTPTVVSTLTSNGTEAAIRLHPGSALQLEGMYASSSNIAFDLPEGRLFAIETLQAYMDQTDQPQTYAIDLTAIGFALGGVLTQDLGLPPNMPDTFEPIILDMIVTFDKPWDRNGLRENRPQPRRITIDKAEALFADFGLNASADIDVDTAGVPSGVINVKLRNWQQMFDLAVSESLVPRDWALTAQRLLTAMSDGQGTLALDITIDQGQMRVGFIPLGPAPRLVIP
ncbi:DUF2125 domain-containing protein [Sulfitobacter sp. F26169L]|uniref:DUF2125 domain-containing protein n=1 Tax=Sulfitobacter sp. F26169L TaxID=2996015 RepID=UPI0022609DD0|nr:DUF2125 domain-containing protein [Sulfitobacter sp. F26169L]MCX7566954.1 DUF2125 domain-containing protein [Sulfitobacter sp. F26169L]